MLLIALSLCGGAVFASDAPEPSGPPSELADPDADLVAAAERYLADDALGPAVEVAQAAAAARPVDRRAQLLSALALARVRVENPERVCDWGAWPDAIEAHLQAAWAMDGDLIQRLSLDASLSPIVEALPNSLALKVWSMKRRPWKGDGPPRSVVKAGLPVRQLDGVLKRKVATAVVPATSWFGVGPGSEADGVELALLADGNATWTSYAQDADGHPLATVREGSWRLDKTGLHLLVAGEPSLLSPRVSGLWATHDAAGEPLAEPVLRFWDRPADCADQRH